MNARNIVSLRADQVQAGQWCWTPPYAPTQVVSVNRVVLGKRGDCVVVQFDTGQYETFAPAELVSAMRDNDR